MKSRFLVFILSVSLLRATIWVSDGSQADVQAKINSSATSGDIVTIPPGTFTWATGTTGATISGKGVKLQGAGSGRVVARSGSSVTVGTGTKVFTLVTEDSTRLSVLEALKSQITNGATLRIWRNGGTIAGGVATGATPWMEGTVTSLSGTTLTMNITSTNGSGTQGAWIVTTPGITVIVDNMVSASPSNLFAVTESTVASTEIVGIRMEHSATLSTTISNTANFVNVTATTGGQPILLHDISFYNFTYGNQFYSNSNKGVIWNCSFVSLPISTAPLAVHVQAGGQTTSWATTSTMGTADLTGKSNLYVEDSDFHAWLNATDFDDNARSSIRRSLFDNAAFGSHGADSSNYGMRHFEVYDSVFFRDDFSDGQTMNVNWWFLIRGGTGVITNCILPRFGGSDYGGISGIRLSVWNLQYGSPSSWGPNADWGTNTGATGANYPCPRQVGRGWFTGTSTTSYSQVSLGAGNYTVSGTTDVHLTGLANFGGTFIGDLEPLYIWGNTPTGGSAPTVLITDLGQGTTNPDTSINYIILGRDYNYDTSGTSTGAKPGWSRYTYPHPLRVGVSSGGSIVSGNPVMAGNLKLQ